MVDPPRYFRWLGRAQVAFASGACGVTGLYWSSRGPVRFDPRAAVVATVVGALVWVFTRRVGLLRRPRSVFNLARAFWILAIALSPALFLTRGTRYIALANPALDLTLYLLALALTLTSAAAYTHWLRQINFRLAHPTLCRFCQYDLQATPSRCPECGAAPSPQTTTRID